MLPFCILTFLVVTVYGFSRLGDSADGVVRISSVLLSGYGRACEQHKQISYKQILGG